MTKLKELEEEIQACVSKALGEPVRITGFRHYVENGERKALIEATVVKEPEKEIGLV